MPDPTPPTSEAVTTSTSEAATTPDLLTAATSDRCANCDAPLATDQRYCVSCGERRGKSRFSMQSPAGSAPPPSRPARERRTRMPAGATLIAGVATLLLAMGVGVLIGQNGTNNNNGKQASASAPQVITVNGGGTAGGSPTKTAAKTQKSGKGGGKSKPSGNKGPVAHLTKKTTAAVNSGVKSVVGSSTKLAPATVKVGGKCANGEAGCHGGKFTGGFFGGGG